MTYPAHHKLSHKTWSLNEFPASRAFQLFFDKSFNPQDVMVCQHCQMSIRVAYEALMSIDFPPSTSTHNTIVLHDSIFNLSRSVKDGCGICRQIWNSVLNKKQYVGDDSNIDVEFEDSFRLQSKVIEDWWNDGESAIEITLSSFEGYIRLSWNERISSYTEDLALIPISTNRKELVPSIGPEPVNQVSIAPSRNFELYNRWFRTCSESHIKCRELAREQQIFAPKRVVEISCEDDGKSFTWRVVYPTHSNVVSYFTLSHCWGSSSRICLTRENRHAFAEFTSFTNLPKTYQDAFLVTFSLGYRFIWIDSLCIMQDDLEDWKAQASEMRSIYKGACCNVAATWAINGDGGCFAQNRAPTFISIDLGLGKVIDYEVLSYEFYYNDIEDAPLNTRGWVVQERYLAKKQLSFADSDVYWECHELVASERFPDGVPYRWRDDSRDIQERPPTTGKPTLYFDDLSTFPKAWAALVDLFSGCHFTHVNDKMVALAGLADEIRNTTGDTYLAGLWKKDLSKQLCWATDFDARRRKTRLLVPTYLAPTWSWVSVDGPVLSDERYSHSDMDMISCIKVLDVSVQSEHVSKLHSFTSSKLVLHGLALSARAFLVNNDQNRLSDEVGWEFRFTNLRETELLSMNPSTNAYIMWDESLPYPEENPEKWQEIHENRQSEFLCMIIYFDDNAARGLVLRKQHVVTDRDEYIRMGSFLIYEDDFITSLNENFRDSRENFINKEIDFDDIKLTDIFHNVTII